MDGRPRLPRRAVSAAARWLRDRRWYLRHRPLEADGHELQLLRGGAAYFDDLVAAIDRAVAEVWLASYIFEDPAGDPSAARVAAALVAAARRGLRVRVVVDGFGSRRALPGLRAVLEPAGVDLAVFRPLTGWWHWLQPRQLRRLHHKLAVVDGAVAWCGGINVIDDHLDQHHGWTDSPRLDYALRLRGPAVGPIAQTLSAVWHRAWLGHDWRDELRALVRHPQRVARMRSIWQRLHAPRRGPRRAAAGPAAAGRAAFVLRDNLRQRRAIEHAYLEALGRAREGIDLVCPYFSPGRAFRQALLDAAARGVRVRLLLQGKVDLPLAALAARVLYEELLDGGLQIYEYTPAFLHAKVARVDDDWATVGSSNIDPLSLLLNLEANVIVRDPACVAALRAGLAQDFALARAVRRDELAALPRWRWALRRRLVAWLSRLYLWMAGGPDRS